jgi:hypothetical protein
MKFLLVVKVGKEEVKEKTMPEQDLSTVANTPSPESSSSQNNSAVSNNHVLAKLILEIQQTPEEYLPNLLQIVRLFRESVTLKPVRGDFA